MLPLVLVLLAGGLANAAAVARQAGARQDIPERPDRNARFLFYLHGRIIEEQGLRPTSPQYGVYEYEEILRRFRSAGFTVISEARAKDTDVKQYAAKVADQIRRLLNAGVTPSHITVVGASKGAVIAMLTSMYLKNRSVNFVLLANCNDGILTQYAIDLWGKVLSIYEVNDEFGNTCRKFFERATGVSKRKEIQLRLGIGHGIVYRPYKEWIEPAIAWAKQK